MTDAEVANLILNFYPKFTAEAHLNEFGDTNYVNHYNLASDIFRFNDKLDTYIETLAYGKV